MKLIDIYNLSETNTLNKKTMKLTDILKDIAERENKHLCWIEIHLDGSGCVRISGEEEVFEFDSKHEELPQAILRAYRNHYKIDNETLTL